MCLLSSPPTTPPCWLWDLDVLHLAYCQGEQYTKRWGTLLGFVLQKYDATIMDSFVFLNSILVPPRHEELIIRVLQGLQYLED